MRVNYVIATWSGSRYNQSKDYLKVHLKRLFELKHNLDQITIVIPLGSDNEEYYSINSLIPQEMRDKVVCIHRPANDRSYGQFIYAYQQYTDQFEYYIIAEDDYIPNIDHFDTILIDLIEHKQVDYVCGKYAKQCKSDRVRAIQNQGIVRGTSFARMLEKCNPVFPVMGPEDGTEQLIFSEYFTNNSMTIGDYADQYPVPYWAKTLMYFSERRGFETIFVPYQCVALDKDSHFLSTIRYTTTRTTNHFSITEPQMDLYPHDGIDLVQGSFKLKRVDGRLWMSCEVAPFNNLKVAVIMYERLSWENRGENLHIESKGLTDEVVKRLGELGWSFGETESKDCLFLYKDYRKW